MPTPVRRAIAAAATLLALHACVGDTPWDLAMREYSNRNFRAAITHLDEVLKRDPENAQAYLYRAHSLAEVGERDKAIADYQHAASLVPDKPDAWHGLGFLYYEIGENDKALQSYVRALQVDPKHLRTLVDRSALYSKLGRFEEALSDRSSALKIEPAGWLFHARGDTLLKLNRVEEALKDYERALAAAPNDVTVLSERAEAHYRRADYAAALADLELAHTNRDHMSYPTNNLAWFLATVPQKELRNGKRAKLLAEWALELERVRPSLQVKCSYLSTMAAALAEFGDFKGAIAAQEQSILLARQLKAESLALHEAHLASYKAGKPLSIAPDQQKYETFAR